MMKNIIKATIIDLIVALLIVIIILISVYLCFGQAIGETIQLVNKIAIKVCNISEQNMEK